MKSSLKFLPLLLLIGFIFIISTIIILVNCKSCDNFSPMSMQSLQKQYGLKDLSFHKINNMTVSDKKLKELGNAIMKINAAKYAALAFPKIKEIRYPHPNPHPIYHPHHILKFIEKLTVAPNNLRHLESNFIICANVINSILLASQSGVTVCNDYKIPPKLKPHGMKIVQKLCLPQNISFPQKDYPLPPPSNKKRLFGVILDDTIGKNLIIAFRGTQTQTDWKWDTEVEPIAVDNSYIARGFYNAYLGYNYEPHKKESKPDGELNSKIVTHEVLKYYRMGYNIFVTGHSLGAAVATITSHFIHKNHPHVNFTTITFGAPRSLSPHAAKHQVNKEFYRVENEADVIPPSLSAASSLSVYAHAGNPFMYSYNGDSSAKNHAFYLQEMVKGTYPLIAISLMLK